MSVMSDKDRDPPLRKAIGEFSPFTRDILRTNDDTAKKVRYDIVASLIKPFLDKVSGKIRRRKKFFKFMKE